MFIEQEQKQLSEQGRNISQDSFMVFPENLQPWNGFQRALDLRASPFGSIEIINLPTLTSVIEWEVSTRQERLTLFDAVRVIESAAKRQITKK